MPGPDLAPRREMNWALPVPTAPAVDGVVELMARDATGAQLWTWTLPVRNRKSGAHVPGSIRREKQGLRVSSGEYALQFHPDGTLASLRQGDRELALGGPSAFAWIREGRGFRDIAIPGKLRELQLVPRDDAAVLARITYAGGTLRSLTWRAGGGALSLSYELFAPGDTDIFGIRFTRPGNEVSAKRWVGAGPHRVWKNRRAGSLFGLHEVAYNDPVPGESFASPEFPGFFADWRWLELKLRDGPVWFENRGDVPFFGLHRPQAGKQPVIELPDLGWSFLHAIPAIGTKFDRAEELGPQSQVTRLEGLVKGEIAIALAPP